MERGLAVRQKNNIDVVNALKHVLLAVLDQVIGQLQAAFHVGAAICVQLVNLFDDVVLAVGCRNICPVFNAHGVRRKLHDRNITLRALLHLGGKAFHKTSGRTLGVFHFLAIHTAGGINHQHDRRIGGSGDVLKLFAGRYLQGDVKNILRFGGGNCFFKGHFILIARFNDRRAARINNLTLTGLLCGFCHCDRGCHGEQHPGCKEGR